MPVRKTKVSTRKTKVSTRKPRVSARKPRVSAKRAPVDPLTRRRSMVVVAVPRGRDITGLNKVGQVIEKSRDGQSVALRLNYNGQLLFRNKKYLRVATEQEKRKDRKEHSRELTIDQEERDILNRDILNS